MTGYQERAIVNDISRSTPEARVWIAALRWILVPGYVAIALLCLREELFGAPHEDYGRAILKVLPGIF
jgi:hypothetical protein